MNKHTRSASKTLRLFALLVLASAGLAVPLRAQEWRNRAVLRVQDAVRERVLRERGGRNAEVVFNEDAARYPISVEQVGVRGTAVYYREGRGRREAFSYDAVYTVRSGRVDQINYRFTEAGGGGRREVPRWLVGTFRGQNPSGRQRVLVTVEDDGDVSAVYGDGRREQGSYEDRQIRLGGNTVWNVSRNNDGFRAQDDSSRRAEDFRRVSPGDNTDDDDDRGGVPRWAVGTFRGTTDSGESELTINRDGTATATALSTKTMFSGSYRDGRLTFSWGSFYVTREADGISTAPVNDRNNRTQYRRVN